MKKGFVCIGLVLVFVLSACGAYAVKGGEVTEYIMNTEQRNNGTYMVWMGADTVTVYCTADQNAYRNAQEWREEHLLVTIVYQTINTGDPDGAFLGKGCDSEQKGVTTLRLVSIALSKMAQKTMTSQAKNSNQ